MINRKEIGNNNIILIFTGIHSHLHYFTFYTYYLFNHTLSLYSYANLLIYFWYFFLINDKVLK